MPELRLADDVRAWQKPETARPAFADRRMRRGNRARSAVSARSNQPWRGESCEGAFLLGERRPHGRSETAHRPPHDSPTLTRHKRFLHQRGEVLGTIPRHQLAHSRKRPNEKGPGLKPGPSNPVQYRQLQITSRDRCSAAPAPRRRSPRTRCRPGRPCSLSTHRSRAA